MNNESFLPLRLWRTLFRSQKNSICILDCINRWKENRAVFAKWCHLSMVWANLKMKTLDQFIFIFHIFRIVYVFILLSWQSLYITFSSVALASNLAWSSGETEKASLAYWNKSCWYGLWIPLVTPILCFTVYSTSMYSSSNCNEIKIQLTRTLRRGHGM